MCVGRWWVGGGWVEGVGVGVRKYRGGVLMSGWVGGAATKLTSRLNHSGGHRYVTSKQVNDLVHRVAPYYTDEQIAFMLNAKHLRTGRNNSFTTARVGYVRRGLHLPPANPGSLPDNNDPTW